MTIRVLQGDEQVPISPLHGRTVAVIGFGNQGAAHAQNMREAGLNVIVGARSDSAGASNARSLNFETLSIPLATQQADLVVLALPDEVQPRVYARDLSSNLKPGATLGFLHGFSIRYSLIQPRSDIGVVMVAPKGPGRTLRDRYIRGQGIPCLLAVHQESSAGDAYEIALAWANAIGCARAGVVLTTFADETETDLFGEQAVLCGGMTHLILAAFETLVQAGYPPELAYLECCHEVKQIADLVYSRGIRGMMEAISNTAEFGAYRSGTTVIDEHVREQLKTVLQRIQDGSFAEEMRNDHAQSFQWFRQQRDMLANHPIEDAGQIVRALMPWLHGE